MFARRLRPLHSQHSDGCGRVSTTFSGTSSIAGQGASRVARELQKRRSAAGDGTEIAHPVVTQVVRAQPSLGWQWRILEWIATLIGLATVVATVLRIVERDVLGAIVAVAGGMTALSTYAGFAVARRVMLA